MNHCHLEENYTLDEFLDYFRAEGANRDRGEKEAMRILRESIRHLGLPLSMSGLSGLKKSDARKAQLAILLKTHTLMSNDWITVKLAMGHSGSVCGMVSAGRSEKSIMSALHKIETVLIREQ